ncbi:hypothetical protein NBRC10512v2_000576 [Rhodotorula toruloides]
MADQPITPPRAHTPHPDSLACVLKDWHFDETPLRADDKPDRIILDDKLVDIVWSSFAPFLAKHANDAFYTQPSTLPTKLAFTKEMVQTEPLQYFKGSFNTQALEHLTIGFISAIDEHLPVGERAGVGGAAFQSSAQTGLLDAHGVEIECTTRSDAVIRMGVGRKLVVEWRDPTASYPDDCPTQLMPGRPPRPRVFRRFVRYLRDEGNIVTFQKFFDSTSTADNDVYTILAKVCSSSSVLLPKSAEPFVIWQMSISCIAHQARHFVLCDFNCWQYGTLVPQIATDDVGVGKFDIVVSPLLPFTSTPCIAQFKARLFYDNETVQKIARERIAVAVADHAQAKRVESSSEAQTERSRGGSSLRDLLKVGASSSDGGRGGTTSVRSVASLADLSLASSFFLSFPDRSTPLEPIFRRSQDSQPGSDDSLVSGGASDVAHSSDPTRMPPPTSPLPTRSRTSASAAPLMLQLCREIGRGSTSIAYLAHCDEKATSSFVVKLPVKPVHGVEAKMLEEANFLASLSDVPYVCHRIAYLESNNERYKCALLLEYGGKALKQWEDLSLRERTNLYKSLVDLHTVHGIQHGDVRPANVVYADSATSTRPDRQLRLVDFAWAEKHACAGEGTCWELEKFRMEADLQASGEEGLS